MSPEFKAALAISTGVHAGLLVGLPVGHPVVFDVERGPASLEVYVVAPPRPTLAPQSQPALAPPTDPVPQTVVSPELRGAIMEVLPGYLRNPVPVYPSLARERGYQGTVLLDVQVLPSGRCGTLRVQRSSGHAVLDEEAARAVRGWRFRPATRGGIVVPLWVEIPITFRLLDSTGG